MHARALSWLVAIFVTGAIDAAAQSPAFEYDGYPAGRGARAIVAADFNRDGWPDVASAAIDTAAVSVLLSAQGDGLAPPITVPVGRGPFDLTTGDFNRDGIPDLAVANADSDSLSILIGRGDGQFTRADLSIGTHRGPRGLTTSDLNGDGKLDLVMSAYDSASLAIFLGNGAGGFPTRADLGAAAHPQGVATGDFNRDGRRDIAVVNDGSPGLVVWYGGPGSFTPVAIPGASALNVVAVADLNGDGWLDVAAASTGGGRVAIYLGGSAGITFQRLYAVETDPRGLAIADVTSDGVADVVTASRAASRVSVLPGDRAHPGAFLPRLTFATGQGSRAVTVADVNVDGRLDLATGNQYEAAVSVLSNVTPLLRAAYTFGRSTQPSGVPLEPRLSQGLGAADFNRDGRLDFVQRVADADNVAVVLTGGATVVLPGPSPYSGHLVEDFNGDGNVDVLIYAIDWQVDRTELAVYLGDGRGHFRSAPATATGGLVLTRCLAGDMDRDGRIDLVCGGSDLRVPNQGGSVLMVMRGNGDGTFTAGAAVHSQENPEQLADVNRDGWLDVVFGCAQLWLGDGVGGFSVPVVVSDSTYYSYGRAADMNHDGYVDLVCSDGNTSLALVPGGAAGFGALTEIYGLGLEEYTDFVIGDVNVDGHLDIVLNFLGESADAAGVLTLLTGRGDGTFGSEPFAMAGGQLLVADVTGDGTAAPDGLPDIVVARGREIAMLSNRRSQTNRPPIITATDVTVAYDGFGGATQCFALPVQASDPDQHALWVEWSIDGPAVESWPNPSGLMGRLTATMACTDGPGTHHFRATVSDFRGAVVSRTVTATVLGPTEIVLHMTGIQQVAGEWAILDDASAASGRRAYNRDRAAPKVTVPAAQPADFVDIGFVADPTQTYKLWLRLKADGNYWGNDSVWVQFSGATDPTGTPAYRIGTTSGLAVNLEECANCGVSGWGWEDDGWGAVNRNGVLLRFPGGGQQTIRVQRREDGVSIDQIVLSAAKYLTTRPGSAKNDTTILKEAR